ncbi:MAG TPA: hypothetical protein PKY77_18890 [Phycisphaerae bacterium]|nr:hypothetical protein [Phycisphaerae bacterium]HRY68471.1 hypothetical protein [Phycisphaerae bacterium]HSA28493.1 hypothetical protein [Phycisphaerae bacterium]
MRLTRGSHWVWGLSFAVFGVWAAGGLVQSSAGEPATQPSADDRAAVKRGDDPEPDGINKREPRGRREGWRDRGERSEQTGTATGEERPRGPRYMGGAGDAGDDRDFLTAEERERLQDFIKEHFPELSDRLRAGRVPQRIAWPLLRLMRIQKSDPELGGKLIEEHRIEMKLVESRRGYRDAPSETARESIRIKIRQLLEQRFDVRQARLELEIRDLQRRIEKARERLAKQQANKAQLVENELEHLTDTFEESAGRKEDRTSLPEGPGGPLGAGPRSERAQPRER